MMAKRVVEFDYDIGNRVRVKAVEMCGQVDSMSLDAQGPMYRVVYWNDGQRYSQWMYGWEVEAC